MDFNELIVTVLQLFSELPQGVQFTLLIVTGLVTVTAHIAPYTNTKKDDFLFMKKTPLLNALKTMFNVVAGNYRNAKNNHPNTIDYEPIPFSHEEVESMKTSFSVSEQIPGEVTTEEIDQAEQELSDIMSRVLRKVEQEQK